MNIRHLLLSAAALLTLASCCHQPTVTEFTAASYNIRYANGGDSLRGDGWGRRCPVITQLIEYHDFDIFGTQEGLQVQLDDLQRALPQYTYIGVGRDDGHQAGEHSAIFYRTDLFEVVDSGDFWLSQTPDHPSIGWDACLPRICTWGHFRYRPTGFEFLFFNLHMDHIGKQARVESAKLVKAKMEELGRSLPAILTGDFNVDQRHDSYRELTADGRLNDSYEHCDLRFAPNGTFNAFNPNGFTTSRIDHIFVSPSFEVKSYGVLTDTYRTTDNETLMNEVRDCPTEIEIKEYQARTPSDHFPVKVELRIEK